MDHSLSKRSAMTSDESKGLDESKEIDDSLPLDELHDNSHAALEKTVWRKLDLWVLPVCTMFFLLAFLDRSNVANARLAGMQTDLKMSNYQYSVALTVTYVPYIVSELPSNLLLKYVGPDLMLPAMVTLWGLVTTLQGFVHNYSGLLACRFFIGFLEGGLFPGLLLYLSFFYPRDTLQIKIASFFASASLAGAFSGLLASAIVELNGQGGKAGWSWIFILEGIFTFLFGLISFFLLPRSPIHARFFNAEEKAYVMSRLKQAGAVARTEAEDEFSWAEVWKAFKLPHVWMLSVALFFNGTNLNGLAYFTPTIVAGLGYTADRAQLMSVPPFAVAFVFAMGSALVSDRYRCRGFISVIFSAVAVAGFAMFLGSSSDHVRYGSLFLTLIGSYSVAPTLATWNANNVAPHVRRASAVAITFILSNAGGILATWLLGSLSPAPNYTSASITSVAFSAGSVLFCSLNYLYLRQQNRAKAERRLVMTRENEPAGLGDSSAWFIYNL